jgi:hypothetical protein
VARFAGIDNRIDWHGNISDWPDCSHRRRYGLDNHTSVAGLSE